MNNLNQILIEGNLTGNPRLTHTSKGDPVCAFLIESIRYFKADEDYEKEISHFEIVTTGELAKNCSENLKKGRGVRVIGRLRQNRREVENGTTVSEICIVADHVIFKPEEKKEKTAS
jgi:single-strand DNA-binding protein